MLKCSGRAVLQIFLTGLTLATAVIAFVFAFFFESYIRQLSINFDGELETIHLPCLRSTLMECDNGKADKCWDYCCPVGYFCGRSPIVGLYCQDGAVQCGNKNWCRDFADISRTCRTEVCKAHRMVTRVTTWSYMFAALAIALDCFDVMLIFVLPDNVGLKSCINIFSSVAKWAAFGLILGAGTQQFMTELEEARCYNSDGMQLVTDSGSLFVSFAIVEVMSAVLSLVLTPFSAYYGGKIQGVPYVK